MPFHNNQPWRTPPFFPTQSPFPGAMPPSAGPAPTPAPAPTRTGPAWLQKFSGGVNRMLGGMAGPPNPYLSPQEQQVAQERQRMAMIAALIGASGPKPKNTQGLLAPFGAAIQAGQQAGDEFGQQALQNQLAQARMAQAQQVPGVNSRYGSPQVMESGRVAVLDRQTGRYVYSDTGDAVSQDDRASADAQIVTLPDGSSIIVDKRQTPGASGRGVEQLVSPEQAVGGAAARAGAERTAADQAAADVKTTEVAPREIQSIDDQIARNEQFLADLRAGKYQTGFFSGMSPAITTQQQLFDVFSAENVIRAISSATFGQLSEGERRFLTGTAPSRNKSEEANMKIIEERIRILNKAKSLEQDRLSGARSRTGTGGVINREDPLGLR